MVFGMATFEIAIRRASEPPPGAGYYLTWNGWWRAYVAHWDEGTGWRFIGIEREPKYFDIACRRIDGAQSHGRLIA